MMGSDPMVVRVAMQRRLAEAEARRAARLARQGQAPRQPPEPASTRRLGCFGLLQARR
jgi:hypothetical protein